MELSPQYFEWTENSTYISGITKIIDEASDHLRKMSQTKATRWEIEKLTMPLQCIDFVKMVSKISPYFPKNLLGAKSV